MSMQDPIADMLTRIRNAQSANEKNVKIPSSKLKRAMLAVLKDEGYIGNIEELSEAGRQNFLVALKYYQGKPVIETIKRVSKPGLRVYVSEDKLPTVNAGMGLAIISTSKGVMTEKAARTQKLGGEILCTVE